MAAGSAVSTTGVYGPGGTTDEPIVGFRIDRAGH